MRTLLKKFHPIYLVFIIVLAWLILALVAVPFSGYSPPGYQTYSLEEGVGHLSFEHAVRFPVKTVQFSEDGNYTMVDLYGPVIGSNRARTRIWVTVTRSTAGPPNATLFLESALGVAETLSGYRFIDRSHITVGGAQAEQISYASTSFRNDYENKVLHLEPVAVINRQIYLAHGDAVWTFAITASEASAEADMVEFERLLASFQFLN